MSNPSNETREQLEKHMDELAHRYAETHDEQVKAKIEELSIRLRGMRRGKHHTEPMMEYCECFDTEDEAIAVCREVNRGLNSKDSACCVVVDGPDDKYAVVDLETAKDLLDLGGETPLPCLVVTG